MQNQSIGQKLHMVFEDNHNQEEYTGFSSYISDVLYLVDQRFDLYSRFIGYEENYASERTTEAKEKAGAAEIRASFRVLEKLNDQLNLRIGKMGEKAAVAASKGIVIPLEYLFRCFHTTPFVKYCVYATLAAEIDGYYVEKYEYYLSDSQMKRPTLDFCINTYSFGNRHRAALLQEIQRERRNLQYLFFLDQWPTDSLLQEPLYLDQRIYSFLYDYEGMNDSLIQHCRIFYADTPKIQPLTVQEHILRKIRIVADNANETMLIYLHGTAGSGKRLQAIHYSRYRNRQLLTVDLTCYMSFADKEKEKFLLNVVREATIRRAYLCFYHYERCFQRESKDTIGLEEMVFFGLLKTMLPKEAMVVFLLSEKPFHSDKGDLPFRFLEMEMDSLTVDERIRLWKEQLCKVNINTPFNIDALSAKFQFSPGVIKEAIKEAQIMAEYTKEGQISEDMLYKACRKQLVNQLKDLAHPVEVRYEWGDLVLAQKQKDQLRAACDQIEYQHLIYDTWGFAKKIAYGKGVSMLFYGPPGTGKTMAAQVIANELHLELYKVDSSAVTSKYIGETQKNLNAVFEGVKKSQSILFFDEADALFGKRSEVKEANDKYANAETAYLLQKMEEHEGVVILATNLMQNFDEAFKRRIKFIIEIPFPNKEERLAMWKKVFPKEAPVGADVDYEYLAQQFELSGSSIKNIAVSAAFLAGAKEKEINMVHILSSLLEEVQKAGKHIGREDLGEYYYLLPAFGP